MERLGVLFLGFGLLELTGEPTIRRTAVLSNQRGRSMSIKRPGQVPRSACPPGRPSCGASDLKVGSGVVAELCQLSGCLMGRRPAALGHGHLTQCLVMDELPSHEISPPPIGTATGAMCSRISRLLPRRAKLFSPSVLVQRSSSLLGCVACTLPRSSFSHIVSTRRRTRNPSSSVREPQPWGSPCTMSPLESFQRPIA